MSIIRIHHNRENPYVQINKKALWDQNLSLEAVGLWARLLSRPDDWHVNVQELIKSCGCGKYKIYRLLNELIKNGYAYKFQPKEGRFYKSYEYYVFEFKVTEEEIQKMFSLPDFQLPNFQLPKNQDHTKDIATPKTKAYINKDTKEQKTKSADALQFGQFVCLSQESHKKLNERFGESLVKDVIEDMNDYCANKMQKGYADYEAAIRNWCKKRSADTKESPKPLDNSQVVKQIIKENPGIERVIDIYSTHVEIKNGSPYPYSLDFKEKGFIHQFDNLLRKAGHKIKGKGQIQTETGLESPKFNKEWGNIK